MRRKIDIRELNSKLIDVLRHVGEERVEYTVTVHGRPVAVIRPLTPSDVVDHADNEVQKELEEMAELARLIGESWSSPKSALQLREEMREESDIVSSWCSGL